jgi:multidrug efflux pump subunit AcrA (membrane-fusion protein)
MIARVSIATPDTVRRLCVPVSSVKRRPEGEPVVYLVDSARSMVFERKVEVGPVLGEDVEILSGIPEGASVAVDGVGRLQDGARIELGRAR